MANEKLPRLAYRLIIIGYILAVAMFVWLGVYFSRIHIEHEILDGHPVMDQRVTELEGRVSLLDGFHAPSLGRTQDRHFKEDHKR